MNYPAGDLRDQLAHLGFEMVRAGLVVGSGGNLSARQPGDDLCWVTASGTWLDRLDRSAFVQVRISDGATVPLEPWATVERPPTGPAPPTSELALHLATYRARPDANAIVHLHPQSVLLLDAIDEPVRIVTTDHALYVGGVARTPFAPPNSKELASLGADAAALGANCIVLAHHGISVLAESVELAHKRASNLEEAARLTYRALAAGVLDRLSECPADFRARVASGGVSAV